MPDSCNRCREADYEPIWAAPGDVCLYLKEGRAAEPELCGNATDGLACQPNRAGHRVLASLVTLLGRQHLEIVARHVRLHVGPDCVSDMIPYAGDTDSIMLRFQPFS